MNRDKIGTLRQLTPRQRQILELVAEGETNREIAEALYISEKTVKNHRYRMCRKLNLSGYNALYEHAILCYPELLHG